jgi:GH43 family beta-xylosidase
VLAGACAPAALANPVVPGDHPDPSLLRAGDSWYATSTSGDWLPAFPILQSGDLARWRQVGSVLARRPAWAKGDFWAPELVRRDGRVFVYYAAKARSGRRCLAVATAARVRGPYRDHGPILCSPIGEIDPLPVTDEQGADWLVWKRDGNSQGQPTPILAAPLAPGGLSLAAPPHELFRADAPWEGGLVEAPAMLRAGGLFYLVYSAGRCCGRHCNYATGVARSASLLGPWEKRPAPILTGGGGIRCPGHVGIARGPRGEPVLAYHAYVPGDLSNRQLLVAPLSFDAAGWPVVGPVRDPAAEPRAARFGFDVRLDTGWEWPAGPAPAARVSGGRLVLGPGALARQTGTTRFTATAAVTARDESASPGLAVMAQHGNAVGVELRGGRAAVWRSQEGHRTEAGSLRLQPGRPVAGAGQMELRVSVGESVMLAVRVRGRWLRVGAPQPLPRWAGGAHAGLSVSGPAGARAQFDSLSIDPR